jgi:hypothetical protein
LSHTLEYPNKLAPLAILAGLNAAAIAKNMGFSQFQYMIFSRGNNSPLLIFTFDKYYSIVTMKNGADILKIIENIGQLINKFISQKH